MNNYDLIFHGYGDEDLPFGMSGVTGLLERLRDGAGTSLNPSKSDMIARYLLDLRDIYWISDEEAALCRGFVSLN